MGACSFQTANSGKSLSDAYQRAIEYAEQEYGTDPYNGTISTTHGVRDVTKDYRASKKNLQAFIDECLDRMGKRDCWAICLEEPKENSNKTKSQVEHIVTPGTKKWELKYSVYNHSGNKLSSFNTKGEAVEFARKRTEKTQETTTIDMEKVLDKVNPRVAKITYKRSSQEKNGRWVFFGYAAE